MFSIRLISCTRRSFAVFCWLVLALTVPGSGWAQETADPSETARFRMGPLRFTPSIVLSSLGVDTNVFNDANDPREDRTAAIGPGVDLWLRVGPSRVSGRTSVQYLYFQTYANQRAWNTDNNLRWEVPLSRLTPFVAAGYVNNKSRPGYEIDSRVRLAMQHVTFGTAVKLGRSQLTLSGRRMHMTFDDEATFLGSNLAEVLNQHQNTEQLELRYRMTSLTTFVVNTEAIQDRFEADAIRNANSIRVLPGFAMKPSALVAGQVFVGLRRFAPLDPLVPDYVGPVASVDATFTARATQLNFKVSRDIVFSYQATQPYYKLTDAGLTITERLSHTWDVVARGGRATLAYVRIAPRAPTSSGTGIVPTPEVGIEPSTPPETNTIYQYGGGMGYRLGRTFRLGFDVIYYRRASSDSALREYQGLRAGASVTYGLPQ